MDNKLNRRDISKITATELGITIADVDIIVAEYFCQMADYLAMGNDIGIKGIGTFETYETQTRKGSGVFEGQTIGGQLSYRLKKSEQLIKKIRAVQEGQRG